MYPYVVVGDGRVTTDQIARSLRLFGKTGAPIPVFQFARDLDKAQEIAEKMESWHKTILICKIEEVFK